MKFRKVDVVEAWEYPGSLLGAPYWLKPSIDKRDVWEEGHGTDRQLMIRREGVTLIADIGDFVVDHPSAGIYPCEQNEFKETYEQI